MPKYPNASFRLGNLADEVLARGKNASKVAKRDLDRYYSLLRRVLPRFDEEEAGFILESIDLMRSAERTPQQDVQQPATPDLVSEYRNFLWATIRMADDTFSLSEKYNVRLDKLESRLRELHPCQQLAVLDAVERALRLRERDPRKAAAKVGLVGPA